MGKRIEKLMKLEEAVDVLAKNISIELRSESVSILDSLHRIVARDIVAEHDFPFFNRSAVDGFAVRAEDTYGASESNPIGLKVVGDTRSRTLNIVKPGEAVKIYTGDPLPSGTDAVVMLEDVLDYGDTIYVLKSLSKYANVALHGEDIQQGKKLIKQGEVVEPKHIVALATLGLNSVEVYEKLRICILCTGSEVVEPGTISIKTVLEKGLIFNSTAYLLLSFLRSWSFVEPIYMGIVRDIVNEVELMINRALDLCHLIITTGGAGPSDYDVTLEVVEGMGGKLIFRGVAMRPGRPTSAGIVNGKPIFMLSGYPVAALIGLRYIIFPALEKALKIRIPRKIVAAKLTKHIANVAGYTTFVRVKLNRCRDNLCAEPIASMGSGTISTLLDSDGILVVPEDVEGFEEGQLAEVELL
ncbi:MAG: molybdopterin molybdotransferase MoeA [Ignisphaera sp.]